MVCQYYVAPDKLDPKFFDPKYVFSELELESANKLNVYHPEKQKKLKVEGYPENDYTLYHKLSARDFVACENAIEMLQNASEIVIDDEAIDRHEKTSKEVRECCKDIKVLGRKDLKLLLNWWKALKETRLETKETDDAANDEDETAAAATEISLEQQEDLEDEEIEKQIAELRETEAKELKRKKKKANKERQKLRERLNLKMIHKGDEGPKLEGEDMFNLNQIQTHRQLEQVTDQTPDVVAESEADSDEEKAVRPKKVHYDKDTGHLDSKGLYYKSEEDSEESDGDAASDSEDDTGSEKSGLGDTLRILTRSTLRRSNASISRKKASLSIFYFSFTLLRHTK